MGDKIFLIWNGWGIFFTILMSLWMILHIYSIEKLGSGNNARNILVSIPIIVIPLTFILSGWILGLIILPVGVIIGAFVARLIVKKK